jgi:iron-sulfur cluster assembly accessory protein
MTTVMLRPFGEKNVPPVATLAALDGLPSTKLPPEAFPLMLTAKAIEMAKGALDETAGEDGEFLRIGVKGGGCAGFQYSLTFTSEVDDDDVVTLVEGLKVVTDTFSAAYLKGTELDYVDGLQGSGFKFLNPSAKRTCGCGSSFAA